MELKFWSQTQALLTGYTSFYYTIPQTPECQAHPKLRIRDCPFPASNKLGNRSFNVQPHLLLTIPNCWIDELDNYRIA